MAYELRAARALGLSIRPAAAEDAPFLASLYASVRAPEFAPLGWPEPVLRQFLAQQEQFQSRQYRAMHAEGEQLVVERAGAPIGRVYVEARADAIVLVDISLLPDCRGLGLGAALLRDLIDWSEAAGKPVLLSVAAGNPAQRLYERLGFRPLMGGGAYQQMRRERIGAS